MVNAEDEETAKNDSKGVEVLVAEQFEQQVQKMKIFLSNKRMVKFFFIIIDHVSRHSYQRKEDLADATFFEMKHGEFQPVQYELKKNRHGHGR